MRLLKNYIMVAERLVWFWMLPTSLLQKIPGHESCGCYYTSCTFPEGADSVLKVNPLWQPVQESYSGHILPDF